jgi:hypothetical protein
MKSENFEPEEVVAVLDALRDRETLDSSSRDLMTMLVLPCVEEIPPYEVVDTPSSYLKIVRMTRLEVERAL